MIDAPKNNRIVNRPRKALLALIDSSLAALIGWSTGYMFDSFSTLQIIASAGSLPIVLYIAGMYEEYLSKEPSAVAGQIALVFLFMSTVIFAPFLLKIDGNLTLSSSLAGLVTVVVALPLWRLVVRSSMSAAVSRTPVLVVGDGRAAERAKEIIRHSPDHFLESAIESRELESWINEHESTNQAAINRSAVLVVLATDELPIPRSLRPVLRKLHDRGFTTTSVVELAENIEQRIPISLVSPDAVEAWLGIRPAGHEVSLRIKRVVDLLVSCVLAIVLMPPALVAGLMMKFSSPGPLFYRQLRVGRGGGLFEIIKFRSMRADAETSSGAVWATVNDPRIPPIGRFLRASRLDEVPQLWNVFRGDMSLVGPRPERPEFTGELSMHIPHFDLRHSVTPGLTGWAQVRYPYGASVQESEIKLEYDLYYVRHWSLLLDLRILIKTVSVVLLGSGAR